MSKRTCRRCGVEFSEHEVPCPGVEPVARFKQGDRVRLTPDMKRMTPRTPLRGIVVGLSRDKALVRVLHDGRKTPYNYSAFYLIRERP